MNLGVYVIKTLDGYELVGKIDTDKRPGDVVRITDPLEIRYRESPLAGTTAVLVKYNYFGSENFIDVFAAAVVCIYKASDEYAKTYEESVKSIQEQTSNNNSGIETKRKDTYSESALESLRAALGVITSNNTLH